MNEDPYFMANAAPLHDIPITLVIDDDEELDFLGSSIPAFAGPQIPVCASPPIPGIGFGGPSLETGASVAAGIGQEKVIPREIIATAIGTTNLQAELGRPVLVGHYNDVPAFLLRTKFSFQRVGSVAGTFSRIQAAQITIVFETLPNEFGKANVKDLHPAVSAWYPEMYEGEVTEQTVGRQRQGSLAAGYMGAGLTMSMGTTTETVSLIQ